jgi:glycosyltransferase involved in cell wall biosynthesis
VSERPRLVSVAPYRVLPPTSGATLLIDGASRAVAERGWDVRVFSTGVRRGSVLRDLFAAEQHPAPGYTAFNHASPLTVLLGFRSRQSTGLPPLGADRMLRWLRPGVLRHWLARADVAQVEGPFGAEAVRDLADPSTPLVLACHNVEGRLAERALAHRPAAVRAVRACEARAVAAADAFLALTEDDRAALEADYGVPPERVAVVPCGVDLAAFRPVTEDVRAAAKARLGLAGRTVAIFTGARYPPNIEAARHLEAMADAGDLPDDFAFLVIGRVGEVVEKRRNLLATGFVPSVTDAIAAADLAVVPVESGGGMHLKVLEFLASGLPVVSTPFGLRGLERPLPDGVRACNLAEMPEALADWAADPARREDLGRVNREWTAARYGWDRIGAGRVAFYDRLRPGGGARSNA